ncbi:hypothetical protein A3A36_02925 [Candidatus Kaiserbacteria bacterium RIFCSPLOWO2_01_FULL_52_12b]|uniref:Uncharacterized protein n=1 Tax=Candidatus Kaiserbacteria bacterium RIFCSPLOWO2_01_FULL_52_12b TaxID=1798509 RepID=A0A1F6EXD1_9BACT|nr:MAG: hypothetical protein A3A36_02925 [Candidatus Kaiserbacteria bacterium RIFCSPLOWO2_01_FULL_52_12b]
MSEDLKKFEELFKVLTTGTRDEIKEAKRRIEKIGREDRPLFRRADEFVFKIIADFDCIPDAEHKAAVISGMSLFYLALADGYFDELKKFIVKNLQYPDGRVREAARKTGEWLFISLSSRAEPFVYPEDTPLTEEQKSEQIIARKQYIDFVAEIESLIDQCDDTDEDAEYIDDMKPSVHKSLQLFWDRLTESPSYRRAVEQSRSIPLEIFMKRKEIEGELENKLKEAGSDFDLEYIKQIIYEEDGTDSLTDIIMLFDTGQGADELQDVLEIVNDAWNYFPHKILDGLSPAERLLEYGR